LLCGIDEMGSFMLFYLFYVHSPDFVLLNIHNVC